MSETPSAPASRSGPSGKLALVAALTALTTGLSGYFVALRQVGHEAPLARSASTVAPEETLAEGQAPLAPRYGEMTGRAHQPNHEWSSTLRRLAPAPVFTATTPCPSAADTETLIRQRAARRAYNGAPPTVPHPIDQTGSASCLSCHGQPTRIGRVDVPQMSHALHSQCIQCHAPQQGPGASLASAPAALRLPALDNGFSGAPPPASGTRAYVGAPPVMPHTTAMRQNCVTCHGPGGSSAIKTTHPERTNCLQCHATDATRETLPPIIPRLQTLN